MIDHDKDGIIGKEDLAFIYDQVGKLVEDQELEAMLEEVGVPINFTQMLHLFAARMSQGTWYNNILSYLLFINLLQFFN